MLAIVLVAAIMYAVLTGAVGARLLILAVRTRALPEVTLGISYILGGMLGWAAIIVGYELVERAPATGHALQYLGLFCLSASHLSVALFSWRVFTPNSTSARVLFFALLLVAAVEYFHNVVLWGVIFPPPTSLWYWPGAVWRTGTYVWMPFVALRYYRRLRLRLTMGLADPVATNRVLLWGLIGLLTLATSVGVIVATLLGLWTTSAAPGLAMLTMVTLAVVSAMGLFAFRPPARYLAWVERRAPGVE